MTEELRNILRDWSALLRLVGRRPTHVKKLVEHRSQYQDFVDASEWGVGGVWFSKIVSMIPIACSSNGLRKFGTNFARPPTSQEN
jgi:hypothetical protein